LLPYICIFLSWFLRLQWPLSSHSTLSFLSPCLSLSISTLSLPLPSLSTLYLSLSTLSLSLSLSLYLHSLSLSPLSLSLHSFSLFHPLIPSLQLCLPLFGSADSVSGSRHKRPQI